ncbi:MAG TPA: YceH family protein [Candidatus Acidoferrales bacterium]|nr:YceH family protein [Candidatus Acidoferrales bacterium]
MNILLLSEIETRVLGSLVEKELTTPEYYPLSLNALVNACNQKSNRDPVMTLDEDAARDALRSLEKKGLAGPADNMVSRVSKYEHRLQEAYNFTRHETAVLAELLLRGPQTPGELRSRADRMHKFDDLGIVLTTLRKLMEREPPLAKLLPRQPGTKEARYAHLLSGDVTVAPAETSAEVVVTSSAGIGERLSRLEDQVETLQSEMADLKQQLATFRKQFE